MQRRTATASLPRESRDLWDYELLDRGRLIRCRHPETFLLYLLSAGTSEVRLARLSTVAGAVEVSLRGPRADDGNYHRVVFCLTREQAARFSPEDRRRLAAALRSALPTPHEHIRVKNALGL